MSTMTLSPPDRSIAQRQAALQTANARRLARAKLKRLLHDDQDFELMLAVLTDQRAAAAEHLPDYPVDVLDDMAVRTLLEAGHRVGSLTVRKLLIRAWGSPPTTATRLAALTDRRRVALVEVVIDLRDDRAMHRRYHLAKLDRQEAVAA